MGPTGSAAMIARIRLAAKNLVESTGAALYAETELLSTKCKERTPVDTGALRAGIHVEGPVWQGRTVSTSVVAGGVSAPYALIVHENLHSQHPVGGAKYIESVFDEERGNILPGIAARVQMGP